MLLIKTLDAYLGLKVDPRPLLKQAAEFEEKLKGLLAKGKKTRSRKNPSSRFIVESRKK